MGFQLCRGLTETPRSHRLGDDKAPWGRTGLQDLHSPTQNGSASLIQHWASVYDFTGGKKGSVAKNSLKIPRVPSLLAFSVLHFSPQLIFTE